MCLKKIVLTKNFYLYVIEFFRQIKIYLLKIFFFIHGFLVIFVQSPGLFLKFHPLGFFRNLAETVKFEVFSNFCRSQGFLQPK